MVGCRPIRNGVKWITDFLSLADVEKAVVDGKTGTDILLDAAKEAGVKRPVVVTVAQIIKANATFDIAME